MATSTSEASLYDRVGGQAGIARLINDFYARVVADPELAPFFRKVQLDKLRHMQMEFFSAALGGPTRYTGRPVAHAHQGLGITLQQFQGFVAHLFETLGAFPLTEAERYDIISRLNTYADEVVGLTGAF